MGNFIRGLRLCCSFAQNHHDMIPETHHPFTPPPLIFIDELIIVEILSWLPVKSLLRFRCVCKSWKSLISDPQFVKRHLRRSATNIDFTNLRLLSMVDASKQRVLSFSVGSLLDNPSSTVVEDLCYRSQEDYYFWVVGSCDGLICLASERFGDRAEYYCVYIWNPATRLKSLKLDTWWKWYDNEEGSEDYWSPKCGFGYDQLSDTYKVVVVLCNYRAKEDLKKTIVKVHHVGDEDNCWRQIQSFPVIPVSDGQFLNGTLNWVATLDTSSRSRIFVIVSLDLGKETCKQLLLPHGFYEGTYLQPTIGVLRDCLCISHDYKRTHFLVWQMKEFGDEKSWTRLVTVSYLDLQTSCLDYRSMLLPVCMSEAGDILMLASFAESRVILYNSRDNRVELYEIVNIRNWHHPNVYVESLVSPCGKYMLSPECEEDLFDKSLGCC